MVVSPTQVSSNACYQVKLMAGNLVFPAFFVMPPALATNAPRSPRIAS